MTAQVQVTIVASMNDIPGCPTHSLKDDNAREWVDHEHAVAKKLFEAIVDVIYDAPWPRNAAYCKVLWDALNDVEAAGWVRDRNGS